MYADGAILPDFLGKTDVFSMLQKRVLGLYLKCLFLKLLIISYL